MWPFFGCKPHLSVGLIEKLKDDSLFDRIEAAENENKNPSTRAAKEKRVRPQKDAAANAAKQATAYAAAAFHEEFKSDPCGSAFPDCKEFLGKTEHDWILDLDPVALHNVGVRHAMDMLLFVNELDSVDFAEGDGADANAAADGDSMSNTYDDPHFAQLVATLDNPEYQGLVLAQSLEEAAVKYTAHNTGNGNLDGGAASSARSARSSSSIVGRAETLFDAIFSRFGRPNGGGGHSYFYHHRNYYYGYRSEIRDQHLSVEDWVAAAGFPTPNAVLTNFKVFGIEKMVDLDTKIKDEENDVVTLVAGLKVVEARLVARAVHGFRARTVFSEGELKVICSSVAILCSALFFKYAAGMA